MVEKAVVEKAVVENQMDLVCRRLAQVESDPASQVGERAFSPNEHCYLCMDQQEQRKQLRQSATRCVVGAWALVTIVAAVASIVAMFFLWNVADVFSFIENDLEIASAPRSAQAAPLALGAIATALFLLGIFAFLTSRFPGLRSIQEGIDWATASDAVAHLLSSGCTYGDSLRGARELIQSPRFALKSLQPRGVAAWLKSAADRVDAGRDLLEVDGWQSSDERKLRLLLQTSADKPGRQDPSPEKRWRCAANHFMAVSNQRLGLLTHSLPPIATILSGILLWISVSSTLGAMWRNLAGVLDGLRGGM